MRSFTMATLTRLATVTTLATLALGAGGCTQIEKIDDGGSSGAGIPDEVQRAFDDSCATVGCHDAATRAQGLDLSAAAAPSIIGGQSSQSDLPLVELGNVQGSYLALKLLPMPPAGAQMPIGGDVEGVDNAIILGWIAGATLPGGGGGGEGGSTDGGETDDPTTPGTEESSGGPDIVRCGLDDVAPDAPNPYDIGPAAGQIPEDVGAVLTNNCGCHEVDSADVIMGAFPYTGGMHFSTIAELQADYESPPGMFRPVYERVLERVQPDAPAPMPPTYYCDLGGGLEITEADQQLLVDWLTAGAPDAASWP